MRLQIDRGSVSLGGKTILDHLSLEIRGKEKIGIVGANGSGKTTLLRLLAGRISPDRDDRHPGAVVWTARNTTIGLLEQTPDFSPGLTVNQMIASLCPVGDSFSRDIYDYETEYRKMFTMLGFSLGELDREIRRFSGGEQTKIALIRLLLMKPDILLLDEPTNHLDPAMTDWLENYLKNYEKAVVFVSHDRYFLDRVADVIYEIDRGKAKRYAGNYSFYRKKREEDYRILLKKYKDQEEERKRLSEWIERFKHKPRKASMARSMRKRLNKMERIPSPRDHRSYLYPGEIIPARPGNKSVFDCERLVIGYGEAMKEISIRVRRGQKIGIMGPNGSGKPTFLRTLAGQIPPVSGRLFRGDHLDIGYFDQMSSSNDSNLRMLEDFQRSFPSLQIKECRKILSDFLFRQEEISTRIKDLSGGEKCRYTLAKLLETGPNVLLLDEPTNHLDIPSREILESAFNNYRGTLIFVTHDRFFLDQVAESLLIFGENGVSFYPFSYAEYREKMHKEEERRRKGIGSGEEENEALRESLKAVPGKERIQSSRLSTEQAYWDWQLGLAEREMEKAATAFASVLEKLPCHDPALLSLYHEMYGIEEEDCRIILFELEKTEGQYTEKCNEWYETWLSWEAAFADYH